MRHAKLSVMIFPGKCKIKSCETTKVRNHQLEAFVGLTLLAETRGSILSKSKKLFLDDRFIIKQFQLKNRSYAHFKMSPECDLPLCPTFKRAFPAFFM